MRFFAAVAAALALATPAFSYTKTFRLTYDTKYDEPHISLRNVTCAHGEHGLLTEGFTTFDSLPTFPFIGGAPQISAHDSRYCGTCWELTYTDHHKMSKSVNFTAIATGKHHPDTFVISLEGLDFLTHGQGQKLKHVNVTATRKSAKACGL